MTALRLMMLAWTTAKKQDDDDVAALGVQGINYLRLKAFTALINTDL